MFAFRDNAKNQIQCVQKALISGATFVGVESRGGGGAFLLCIVPLLQFSSIQKTLIIPQGAILLWPWRARKVIIHKSYIIFKPFSVLKTSPPTNPDFCRAFVRGA